MGPSEELAQWHAQATELQRSLNQAVAEAVLLHIVGTAVSRHTMQALQPEESPVRQLMGAEALEPRQGPAAVPDTQQEWHSPAAGSGFTAAAETDGQAVPSGGRQPQLKRAAVAVGADEPAVLVRSAQAAWQRAREQAAAEARRSDRGVHLLPGIQADRPGTAHSSSSACHVERKGGRLAAARKHYMEIHVSVQHTC